MSASVDQSIVVVSMERINDGNAMVVVGKGTTLCRKR